MKRALCLAALLVACAPRSAPPGPSFTPGGTEDYAALIAPFSADLARAGIHLTRATPYRYTGSDPGAFQRATALFYQQNPGFCPAQGGFLTAPDRPVFLTVAVRGAAVRVFVYDQAARPNLSFAFAAGQSDRPLPRDVCPPGVAP